MVFGSKVMWMSLEWVGSGALGVVVWLELAESDVLELRSSVSFLIHLITLVPFSP
jgi:hypothetical protein